jgi:hypothetical protein
LFVNTQGLEKITYDLATIFNKAYSQSTTISNGVSGFKATGIYPLHPSVFSEEYFVAVNTLQSDNGETVCSAHTPDITGSSYSPEQEGNINSQNPVCFSPATVMLERYKCCCPTTVPSLTVSVEAVSPLPMMGPQTPCRKRRVKQHSEILARTPMKVSLESKAIKRNARAQKRSRPTAIYSKKRQNKETSLKERRKSCRKNLKKQLDLTSSEDDTNINDQNVWDDNEENDIETVCEKCFIFE